MVRAPATAIPMAASSKGHICIGTMTAITTLLPAPHPTTSYAKLRHTVQGPSAAPTAHREPHPSLMRRSVAWLLDTCGEYTAPPATARILLDAFGKEAAPCTSTVRAREVPAALISRSAEHLLQHHLIHLNTILVW